jgi:hypothetical protein
MKFILNTLKVHKWFAMLLLFQAIIFSAPHIYGVLHNEPDKYFFTGQFGYYEDHQKDINAVCDNCFYLGWGYKQAMDGHFILEDKFQGYDTYRKVFHFWWVIGGHLARILGIDLITFNLLQRVFSGLLLSYVLYAFGLIVFKSKRLAIFGVMFYVFSNFLLFPWPEASVFISNMAEVILPLGNALLVLLLFLTYQFFSNKKGNVWIISFTALMLEMDYPYGIIMYCNATAYYLFFLLFTKRYAFSYLFKNLLIITVPALIVVAYNYYLVATDYRLVDCQANNPSPYFWKLIVGYLPFSAMTVISILLFAIRYKNEWDDARWYLLFLLISNLTLMRVPIEIIPFQMEMIVGIQLPLAFFSVDLIKRLASAKAQVALAILISALSLLSVSTLAYRAGKILHNYARPSYIEIEHYEAMQWLDKNTSGEDQVLAMNYLSSYIPMLTGNRIYNGEYKLITAFFEQRQEKFESALSDPTGETMKDFLLKEKIDYILYCDSMAIIDKSGIINFAIQDKRFSNIFINNKTTVIKFQSSLNP